MDKVILGKGVVLEDGLGISRPNNNQIIVGGTGTGKSLSVLWPTMCHMRESSFMGTFAKSGEVIKAIPFFKEFGYKEIIWNLADPAQGDPLPDPLLYIASDDDLQQIEYCHEPLCPLIEIFPDAEFHEGVINDGLDFRNTYALHEVLHSLR